MTTLAKIFIAVVLLVSGVLANRGEMSSSVVHIAFLYWLSMFAVHNGRGVAQLLGLPGSRKAVSSEYLGPEHTWGECYIGPALAIAALLLEEWAFDISIVGDWEYGAAIGAGATLGECIKSYFKHLLRKAEGTAWEPLDTTAYVFGGWAGYALLTVQWLNISLELYHCGVLCLQLLLAVLWVEGEKLFRRVL